MSATVLITQTHHFAPPRPPSPSFLRFPFDDSTSSDPLLDHFVSTLLPDSSSPTTGPSLVSDSPSPSSPAKPAFTTLARTPSSAFVAASAEGRVNPLVLQAIARRDSEYEAIRVVREQVERERRRESSGEAAGGGEGGSGEGGGGGGGERPNLLRKQSWTAMARAAGVNVGGGGAGGRSESPTQMSEDELPRSSAGSSLRARRGERGTALGLVSEEGGPSAHSGDGQERTDSGDTIAPAARSTDPSGSTRRPLSAQQLVDAPSPSPAARAAARNRNVSSMSTSSALSVDPPGSTAGGKKRGPFRSFFSRSRTPSQNLSAQGPAPVASPTGAAREPMTPPMSAASANGSFPGTADSPALGGIERRETKAEKGEKVIRPKVRAKGKSTKEFNDLFLAQELSIPWPSSGPSPAPARDGGGDSESIHSGAPDVPDSASLHSHATHEDERSGGGGAGGAAKGGKKKKAVWAVKFSDDGKFLAVGGKDGVVRVWEVLSTPEEREATLAAASTSQQFDPVPLSTTEAPAGSRMSGVPATPSSPVPPPTPTVGPSGRKKGSSGPREPVCVMPVFASKPVREFKGHEADVLDLSWSKNNFLLSSSMDKTVRLWHVSRNECLCAFQHLDFVTSIAFHPKDDRFFLSGSLDCKLRLWNIPEKRVHIWTELPELITAVSFTRDGKLAIAGTFAGAVMFFEVETFRYHAQFAAKSSRGKNSKGKKVTSLTPFPLPSSTGERLLVTTNDSRLRLYHTADKILETKYAGHENTSSQIRASFSDDGRWIISGSEDRNVYIWDSGLDRRDDGGFHLRKKQKDSPHEHFAMFAHIVTAAVFAPTHSREHLAAANDPIFADGHTHFAPLEQTMSGASLDLVGVESHNTTCDSIPRSVLVPATSRDGKAHPTAGGAQDAILVVADDETGTISVFRNSKLSPATLPPLASPALSAGAASSLKRDKSKRWSRVSEAGR
ncbi:hypothetical protein Rhopal_007266-T1 [Rhodotorula paludigena]|uniref:WD repeat-containing protein 44 n=1 Tax=Rhodotorula paludigena TaxID=86838 RepID=A0AAV5GYU1_9BASI|nr:hypothetical protein Rhopal_007266-T1 [Rhodotorula paludigena]